MKCSLYYFFKSVLKHLSTAADLKSDCAAWVRCFLNVVTENKRENVIEVWLKCHRADVGLWRRESSWLGDVNNSSPADCRETQPDWIVTHTLPFYSVGCKVISTASPIHTVFLIHGFIQHSHTHSNSDWCFRGNSGFSIFPKNSSMWPSVIRDPLTFCLLDDRLFHPRHSWPVIKQNKLRQAEPPVIWDP